MMTEAVKRILVGIMLVIGVVLVAYLVGRIFPSPSEPRLTPTVETATSSQTTIPGKAMVEVVENRELQVGKAAVIDIFLSGFTEVQGVEIGIAFDPGIIQVDAGGPGAAGTGLDAGECPHPDFVARSEVNNQSGNVRYAAASTSGTCSEGRLFSLKVVCLRPAITELEIVESLVSDSAGLAVPHKALNGEVECQPASLSQVQATTDINAATEGRPTETPIRPSATPTSAPQIATLSPTATPLAGLQPTATSTAELPGLNAPVASPDGDSLIFLPLMFNQSARLSISPASQTISGSAVFTVRANGFNDLFGGDISISFDPARLQITQMTPGTCPFPDLVVQSSFDNTLGQIDYALTQLNPSQPCSEGVMLNLAFECVSTGVSPIAFESSLLANPAGFPIPHTTISGAVTCQ